LLEERIDYTVQDGIEVIALHKVSTRNALIKAANLICDAIRLKRIVAKRGIDTVLSFMQRPNTINMLSKTFGSHHKASVSIRVCLRMQYEKVPFFIKFVSVLFLRWLWHYASRTITNSRIIKSEITNLFNVDPETIDVVYNPLNINEIKNRLEEPVDEEWFRKKDTPIIINVGRLTVQKGHIYLLEAVSLIARKRPVRLVIIGEGELKGELVKEAERLGIVDKVLFMGLQKNPYKYIARSDVFVLSSLWEGFPNVVLEAMACRCPVVVADCLTGPAEILLPKKEKADDIIETRYGLLVNNPTRANISKAIETFLNDKDMGNKYVEAAFDRAKHFELFTVARHYEEALLKTSGSDYI
jgi:glycosyltransferase involved in cell wall biosynthesis